MSNLLGHAHFSLLKHHLPGLVTVIQINMQSILTISNHICGKNKELGKRNPSIIYSSQYKTQFWRRNKLLDKKESNSRKKSASLESKACSLQKFCKIWHTQKVQAIVSTTDSNQLNAGWDSSHVLNWHINHHVSSTNFQQTRSN